MDSNPSCNEQAKRPMLSPKEMTEHLEKKGVRFDICSKEQAEHCLEEHNNFFKLTAYRKNYPKHPDGINKGKYIDLDFAYLEELSVMDMRLRYTLLQACLDIEHYLKIGLITTVEQWDKSRAYSIVNDFYASLEPLKAEKIKESLDPVRVYDIYRSALIQKFYPDFPIWAFSEVITFGDLIKLYLFVNKQKQCCTCDQKGCCIPEECPFVKANDRTRKILLAVSSVRNACAHNSCILNDLSRDKDSPAVQLEVKYRLYQTGLPASYIQPRLRSTRLGQIVTLLYAHERFVTSEKVHDTRFADIRHVICDRFQRNAGYFSTNLLVSDMINFLKNILDRW